MGNALATLRKSVTRRRRSMGDPYQEVISLVERSHRQFLEVVKLELEAVGIYDINNVQAVMLFNIGDAEMTVGELTLRGCYLGSNVSYNVKKMVENEYLAHERSMHDRRAIHVRLTEKGIKLRDNLAAMHRRHTEMLLPAAVSADDLRAAGITLRRLERFWMRAADLVQRPAPVSSLPAQPLSPDAHIGGPMVAEAKCGVCANNNDLPFAASDRRHRSSR